MRSLRWSFLFATIAAVVLYQPPAEVPPNIRALGGVEVERTERTTTYQLPSGLLATTSVVPVDDAAYGASDGPLGPSSCTTAARSGSSQNWQNASNAQTSNNTRADTAAGLTTGQFTNYLVCTNFGFSIGSGQQLAGIQVTLEMQASGTTKIFDGHLRLVTGGTIDTNAANDRSSPTAWPPTTDALRVHGASTDLWGRTSETFFPSDVNASNFGAALSARMSGTGTHTPRVDHMTITIFHFPPKGAVYISGFETREDELDWLFPIGASAYTAGAATNGGFGIELTSSISGSGAQRCAPTSLIDTDIVIDGYTAANMPFDASALAVGRRMVALRFIQGGPVANTTGCYVEVERTTSGVDFSGWYAGTPSTHIFFGTVSKPLGRYTLNLNQHIISGVNDQVLCQLSLYDELGNGGSAWDGYATMVIDECPGVTCEIDTVCIGSPGAIRGANLGPGTLKFDDWVIGNYEPVGIPAVHALYPPGAPCTGGTFGWGSNGSSGSCSGSNLCECIDDWSEGVADLHGNGGGDVGVLHKGTLGGTLNDTFPVTDPPTPTTRQKVKFVQYYASGANLGTPSTFIRPFIISNSVRSNGLDTTVVPTAVPVALRGSWPNDPQPTPTGTPADAPTWAPTRVQGLQAGYERDTAAANGDASVTAQLLYALYTSEARKGDNNLQDWSLDSISLFEPEILMTIGIDSISAATNTASCRDAAGTCSETPCLTDTDCQALQGNGACWFTGVCIFPCTTNADCTCGVQAFCQGDKSIINQLGTDNPQISTLVNYGRSGNMLKHYKQMLMGGALDDSALRTGTFSQAATLAKGSRGHCSVTTTNKCKSTAVCPSDGPASCCPAGETCIPHGIDYAWGMGGFWENLQEGNVQSCSAPHLSTNQLYTTNLPNCPAAVPRTPVGYEVVSHDCTNPAGYKECVGFTPTPQPTKTPCSPQLFACGFGDPDTCAIRPHGVGTPAVYECIAPNPTPQPTPTPCTVDGDCTGGHRCLLTTRRQNQFCSDSYAVPPGQTTCMNTCEGHLDPVWHCQSDFTCAECSNDSSIRCMWWPASGVCTASCTTDDECGQYVVGSGTPTPSPNPVIKACSNGKCRDWGARCDTAADCSAGAECLFIEDYPIGIAATGGNAYYNCPSEASCLHNKCTAAAQRCSVPCSAKECTTDAQCGPLGGLCGGDGRCKWCGMGNSLGHAIENSDLQRATEKAWTNVRSVGSSPLGVADTHEAIRAYVEDVKRRRYLALSYGLSFYQNISTVVPAAWEFNLRTQRNLPRNKGLKYLDSTWRSRSTANMVTGGDEDGILQIGFDIAHLTTFGVAPVVETSSGWLKNAFPVCSLEPDQLCGACYVGCTADLDCNKPTPSFTPTPSTTLTPQPTPTNAATYTPVAGSCNAGMCRCTGNGQCASGECATVIPNIVKAGTPTPTPRGMCLSEARMGSDGLTELYQCPAGDGTKIRRLIASDRVCTVRTPAAGVCSQEITRPRCVDAPKQLCRTDKDCPKGGPCSHNAVFVTCYQNADCNGNGMDPNDVCTNDPTVTVGPTTPTPTGTIPAKHCRQPTP